MFSEKTKVLRRMVGPCLRTPLRQQPWKLVSLGKGKQPGKSHHGAVRIGRIIIIKYKSITVEKLRTGF